MNRAVIEARKMIQTFTEQIGCNPDSLYIKMTPKTFLELHKALELKEINGRLVNTLDNVPIFVETIEEVQNEPA